MIYENFGVFEIPVLNENGRRVDDGKVSLIKFWDEIEDAHNGLSEALGCYVFSIRAGKGFRPWYVGMTKKQGFRKECFQAHKLLKYNSVLHKIGRGTPVFHLVARKTERGKFSKTIAKDIVSLEFHLISLALIQNRALLNKKDTSFYRKVEVPGIINSAKGKLNAPTKALRTALGVKFSI